MKKVAFTSQVLSLLGMLPILALLHFHHAAHDRPTMIPAQTDIPQQQRPATFQAGPAIHTLN